MTDLNLIENHIATFRYNKNNEKLLNLQILCYFKFYAPFD